MIKEEEIKSKNKETSKQKTNCVDGSNSKLVLDLLAECPRIYYIKVEIGNNRKK